MQLIFLPDIWTVLLCFLVWAVLQAGTALVCLHLPDRFFLPDSFLYRSRRFEKEGRIYDRIFRISRWKHMLPDGGSIWGEKGFKKRQLADFSNENLNRFLTESARGELTHWLAIFPFWIFGFFAPPQVVWMMLVYALLINLPCIMAQRYNRPRIRRLLKKRQHPVPTS